MQPCVSGTRVRRIGGITDLSVNMSLPTIREDAVLRTRHQIKKDRRDYKIFLQEGGLSDESSDSNESSLSTLTSSEEEQDRSSMLLLR